MLPRLAITVTRHVGEPREAIEAIEAIDFLPFMSRRQYQLWKTEDGCVIGTLSAATCLIIVIRAFLAANIDGRDGQNQDCGECHTNIDGIEVLDDPEGQHPPNHWR